MSIMALFKKKDPTPPIAQTESVNIGRNNIPQQIQPPTPIPEPEIAYTETEIWVATHTEIEYKGKIAEMNVEEVESLREIRENIREILKIIKEELKK
jgi:hypothetical protein